MTTKFSCRDRLEQDKSHRRVRRDIPKPILQELSFSGRPMKKDQIAKAIDYPKAHPVVPGGSISRVSGVESEAGLGSTFSGGLDRSARMPVAVLRRRGSRRTVGTPFGDCRAR